MTFNILFDTYRGKSYKSHILHSVDRYRFILKGIEEVMPDVIGLN